MPVESAADRAVFINPDEFGVTLYLTGPYGPVEVNAIRTDADGVLAGLDAEVDVVGRTVTLQCRSTDLVLLGLADGEVVRAQLEDPETSDPVQYLLTDIRQDGTGMSLLTLELEDASA